MKKFKTKTKRKTKKKLYLFVFLFFLSLYISFKYLEKSNIVLDDKNFVKLLLKNNYQTNILKDIFNETKDKLEVSNLIKTNYVFKEEKKVVEETKPIIYIYNSHQTEEYSKNSLIEYNINPTVLMPSYILEGEFNKNNLKTIVEERSIKDLLNINSWNYAHSYEASRIYMEDSKKNNPSLIYFIDLHRDSLSHDKTVVSINDKPYAKTVFIIGLENPNYQENLKFTEKLNNKLNEEYPGLSKGIYKKEGPGVNGVYNQDFSKYTILIEIGGNESTIEEVMNSALAFSKVFIEVINENEG